MKLLPPGIPSRRRRLALLLPGGSLVLGWFLVLLSLQLFVDFRALFAEEDRWLREDLSVVFREVSLADTLGTSRAYLTGEDLTVIADHRGVARLTPVARNHYPASVDIGGGMFPTLHTDVFFEALPDDFFGKLPPDWHWDPDTTRVPLLVPGQFLHLYNFGFAPGKGLPQISPATAKQVRFKITATARDGSRHSFPTRIVGFSEQITSLHVPWSFLEWSNAQLAPTDPTRTRPSRAVLVFDSAPDDRFLALLKARNLSLDEAGNRSARLQTLLTLGILALFGVGALVAALALLLAFSLVEQQLAEREADLRRLFFLGFGILPVAARVGGGMLLLFSTAAALALLAVSGTKQLTLSRLTDGGFTPPENLAPWVWLTAALLWFSAATWSALRLRHRLRQFV